MPEDGVKTPMIHAQVQAEFGNAVNFGYMRQDEIPMLKQRLQQFAQQYGYTMSDLRIGSTRSKSGPF